RDIEAYGRELDALRARFNPVFAVQQRFQQELEEANRALRVGAISQEEYAAAATRLRAAQAAQIAALNRTGAAAVQASGGMRRFGFAAQQAGFQIGDVATQI